MMAYRVCRKIIQWLPVAVDTLSLQEKQEIVGKTLTNLLKSVTINYEDEAAKMCLETTIPIMFNYYFDAERDGHADTVRLFEASCNGKYDAYMSDYAVLEIQTRMNPKEARCLH